MRSFAAAACAQRGAARQLLPALAVCPLPPCTQRPAPSCHSPVPPMRAGAPGAALPRPTHHLRHRGPAFPKGGAGCHDCAAAEQQRPGAPRVPTLRYPAGAGGHRVWLCRRAGRSPGEHPLLPFSTGKQQRARGFALPGLYRSMHGVGPVPFESGAPLPLPPCLQAGHQGWGAAGRHNLSLTAVAEWLEQRTPEAEAVRAARQVCARWPPGPLPALACNTLPTLSLAAS